MRKIVWWLGSDCYLLVNTPPGDKLWQIKLIFYRLKWKFLIKFFDIHWVVDEYLTQYLLKFGVKKEKIQIKEDKVLYDKPLKKIKHIGFNVLYYMPRKKGFPGGRKRIEWTYGYDIYKKIKKKLWPKIDFIEVYGEEDMNRIYPIVDLYIRPTRSDGRPRMIDECKISKIPYIFSRDGNPDSEEFINEINAYYESRFR